MNNQKAVVMFLALWMFFILILPAVTSEVIVFDKYDSSFTIKDGHLFVEKNLRLKNVGNSPIIPGEIHFKISQEGSHSSSPTISNFAVLNAESDALDTQIIKTDSQVSLIFTIWDPLLPGFFYDVKMTYELNFKPKGVLFYSVTLPQEKTTIPIKEYKSSVILSKLNHFTYAPNSVISSIPSGRMAVWDEPSAIDFEYSIIPLPKLGFRAVNLFWIIIMFILAIQLFIKVKKLRRL